MWVSDKTSNETPRSTDLNLRPERETLALRMENAAMKSQRKTAKNAATFSPILIVM
jgi:hypothetical protein